MKTPRNTSRCTTSKPIGTAKKPSLYVSKTQIITFFKSSGLSVAFLFTLSKKAGVNMKKKNITDSLIIGAALFSTLFGAGNMIFPPYLGLESGTAWLLGFSGFYVADVGLAMIAIWALVRKGSFSNVLKPIGRRAGTVLTLAAVLCLGPVISVPRTCATTFELSILPLFKNADLIVFGPVFFAVTLIFAMNETKIIDIVGMVLTPLLVSGLLLLILKGVISPISAEIDVVKTPSPVGAGIKAGYQSMDVLGAAVLDSLIIGGALSRGYKGVSLRRVVLGAIAVAGLGLFAIYLGLTYLGATASTVFNMHTSRTQLLTGIVNFIMPGKLGLIIFGAVAGLACLTTSVALTGATAKYLEKLSGSRISYTLWVLFICICACFLSTLGVERIVSAASPILTAVYPPILAMLLLSFFDKYLTPLSYRLAASSAAVYGIIEAVYPRLLGFLPFSDIGIGWLIPCALLAIIVSKYIIFDKN